MRLKQRKTVYNAFLLLTQVFILASTRKRNTDDFTLSKLRLVK